MPDDCDPIEFYPPNDVFGGTKPVPSCLPGTTREPNELREPTGDTQVVTTYKRPGTITVGNMEVTVSCETGSIGNDVTVDAGTLTGTIPFSNAPGITEDVLDYIATHDLVAWINEEIKLSDFSAEDLAGMTGMTLADAGVLLTAMRTLQRTLTAGAESMAESQLECHWENTPQTATCEDPAMAHPSDHPDAIFTITVPQGQVTSTVSQEDADTKAMKMAEGMLNCFYASDQFTATCATRPTTSSTEEVPNDTTPIYTGLPLRVGTVTVLPGQFTSVYSKSDANMRAQDFAFMQLVCFYVNDPYYLACEDPDARGAGVDPVTTEPAPADLRSYTKGQTVAIPQGYITSEMSTADANEKAANLASSLLECCYINKAAHIECEPFELLNSDGSPVLDVYGNPVFIQASQTDSPTFSIDIPAGEYTSCESQEMADSLAEAALQGLLNCYYCNQLVLPTCVPEWVLTAASTGILREDGTVYKIDLPLDTRNLINPYTGEPEDMSKWSVDATTGMNADAFCSQDFKQSQQIAESAAQERVERLVDTRGECQFTNDLVIAACAALDPYDPTNPLTDHNGTTPSGETYRFYSKFAADACLAVASTSPAPGSYIEIQAGTIMVTALDTPGTVPDTDPGYSSDANNRLTKEYANQLAFQMATASLYCVFANPRATGTCDGATSPLPGEELCGESWAIGGGRPSYMLSPESNSISNPIQVTPGMFTSPVSMEEVYSDVYQFVTSTIYCEYCNEAQEAECDDPSLTQLSKAAVAQCTVRASTLGEANKAAKAMAQSMVACVDLTLTKGEKGDPGPAGADGAPGAPGQSTGGDCSGSCYGVYS